VLFVVLVSKAARPARGAALGAKKSRARGRGKSLGRKRPGRAETSETPHNRFIRCNAQRSKSGWIKNSS
jgi:hypothetical protein